MTRRIKILHAIRQGTIGGGESHVLDLTRSLNKEKFESIVLSFTEGQMVDSLREIGIKTYVVANLKPFNFLIWKHVTKIANSENVDIVHAHGTRAASNLFWTANKIKVPLFYTIHGWSFNDNQGTIKRNISVKAEKYLTEKATVNISVSETNQKTGRNCIKGFASEVIKNGINTSRFNTDVTTNIRAEIGIPSDHIVIGFIARITKQKDPHALVTAFRKVCDKFNKTTLLIVGDGELKEDIVLLSKELNVYDRINFQPFRQDIPNILKSIDIYCLPSLWEGLSIGLLEAMAMGKAIVATKVDGTIEVLRDRSNGLLVESGDVDQLARALSELCQNSELRKNIGISAYNTISEEFNVEKMAQQVELLYSKHVK